MPSLLDTLRQQAPQVSPEQFVAGFPGAWIQYYDDTPAKDPAKALSMSSFDPAVARRKQRERCAVCFSLQVFGVARTREGLICYQNLGVDVDLIPPHERRTLSLAAIDKRKEHYLRQVLRPFPLNPHCLIETRHGFHLLFRLRPLREPADVAAADITNRRLVRALRGDERACLLTQVLRVPDTEQFKNPARPFLCRLLIDNSPTLEPYDLNTVRDTLDAWEVFHPEAKGSPPERSSPMGREPRTREKDAGLAGVPEGQRNATAASVVGRILVRLPEELWEIAGWGGLKEWNGRNAVPLPERELRAVFASIARRERVARLHRGIGWQRIVATTPRPPEAPGGAASEETQKQAPPPNPPMP